jgi:hypothetical protein
VTSSVHIYGAGMAGLLTANMLRRYNVFLYDAQPSLPNNHEALLRFRTSAVEEATNIPFRKVRVLKAIKRDNLEASCSLDLANLYSYKVTGEVMTRSVLNLDPCERYIAPPTFIGMMASMLRGDPLYNTPLTMERIIERDKSIPIISTIPMPVLMKIVGWPQPPQFNYRTVWTITATLARPATDVYQTIYYPKPRDPYYRASITGDRLIIESMHDLSGLDLWRYADAVGMDFGLVDARFDNIQLHTQPYGKLLPIAEEERRAFILAMTNTYNVYSVGRFATWRQILMDDVVEDVRKVEHFIRTRDNYSRHLDSMGAR